jgi:hypothetical protein
MSPRPSVLTGAVLAAVALAAPAAAPAATSCTDMPQRGCLYPFPNDAALTKKDPRSATARRVSLPPAAMPADKTGKRVSPVEFNRNDGFSPGQPIVLRIPGVGTPAQFKATGLNDVTDVGRSLKPTSRLVIADVRTGKRWPAWAELDALAKKPADRMVIIHPAKNLTDGHTYVVALRGIGRRTPPRFARDRDKALTAALKRAKVRRGKTLYLAWTFTVASTKNLAGRALAIRDDAFRQLGDTNLADGRVTGRSPSFTITGVTDVAEADDAKIARKIEGTIDVPCYLDKPGCPPGSKFHYGSTAKDATPTQQRGNVFKAPFFCNIPRAATPAAPARVSLYGHGLLGKATEINAGNVRAMSNEHDMVFCATPWAGMSNDDIANAVDVLGDFDHFPTIGDRLQQGFVAALYLGRAMIHPDGFARQTAFQQGGAPVIDTSALYYDGNSQGGINGGALTALAPDFRRAVLGVPGMNYATLLPRSVDFDTYALVMYPAYPDESSRPALLSLVQMLWDRGEANGYANHMTTDPLPNTPSHTVLMHAAVGDQQVSGWTAEVEARTIGARTTATPYAPGRTLARVPAWGIPRIAAFPYSGSAIVFWDSGAAHNGVAPAENVPPRQGEDPHEDPRATKAARAQKSAFLKPDGAVVNVCGGAACASLPDNG